MACTLFHESPRNKIIWLLQEFYCTTLINRIPPVFSLCFDLHASKLSHLRKILDVLYKNLYSFHYLRYVTNHRDMLFTFCYLQCWTIVYCNCQHVGEHFQCIFLYLPVICSKREAKGDYTQHGEISLGAGCKTHLFAKRLSLQINTKKAKIRQYFLEEVMIQEPRFWWVWFTETTVKIHQFLPQKQM